MFVNKCVIYVRKMIGINTQIKQVNTKNQTSTEGIIVIIVFAFYYSCIRGFLKSIPLVSS